MQKLTVAQLATLAALTAADVVAVYSGKPGCACGCRGKYSYSSEHRARASKHRGYRVEDDEISDRNVTRILNLMKANANDVQYIEDGIYVFDLHENRTYTLYTLDSHK